MMPAAKRRKVATPETRNRPSTASAITAFAKISKSYAASKCIQDKSDRLTIAQVVPSLGLDRKRKLSSVNDDKSDGGVNQAATIQDIEHFSQRRSRPHTPKKSGPTPSVSSSLVTPTKGAQGLPNELLLSSSLKKQKPSPVPSQESIDINVQQSSIGRPAIEDQNSLPTELIDLANLHSSFLTALTLHHAHNGPHSPADLQMLCPDVARVWGKRKVLLADIQRILGVLNSSRSGDGNAQEEASTQINLSNYGHGKICVEVKRRPWRGRSTAAPLDETNLNDTFMVNLRALWREHQNPGRDSIPTFIKELPQETITICSSLAKLSPMLAKGQRRLEDLRTAFTVKKQDERKKAGIASAKEPAMSLLQRIKAKQMRLANLPPPPSKEELGRKAALHRLVEAVAILTVLTTSTSIGQERVSFTMATVLGRLKDSFRTPISKEEGETCVRLLAGDIAPEWLGIVKMGKFDTVVVTRKSRPSDLDVQDRIKRAI